MKIDDSILIRFINNDLPKSKKDKIQLLLNNNPKIKNRVQGLINLKFIINEESKTNKKIKMPKSLYKKISSKTNIEKKHISNNFANFYKIAAGILVFVSISWLFTMPNKTYLSQKNYISGKYNQSSKIYYTKSERDQFLSKYKNCKASKEKVLDENDKEVFPVICRID